MNKSEFIKKIAVKTGLTQDVMTNVYEEMVDTIVSELNEGNDVNLTGFGKFKVTARAARDGRNPKTGETIKIAASNNPSFSAWKSFKEAIK